MSALRTLLCFVCIFALACEKPSTPPEETAPEEQQATEGSTGEQEPAAPTIDCPELSITVDGEPFQVVTAMGFRVVARGVLSGHRIMLTDEDITCSAVMDYDYAPSNFVTAVATPDPQHNSLSTSAGFQVGPNLELVRDPEDVGEELAICLHEPITIMWTRDEELSVVGLFTGVFCGEQVYD